MLVKFDSWPTDPVDFERAKNASRVDLSSTTEIGKNELPIIWVQGDRVHRLGIVEHIGELG